MGLVGLIRMANIIITFKIMPEDADINLTNLKDKILSKIKKFGGEVGETKLEPLAFGLNSLKVIFIFDESKGGTESLENEIKKIKGISNVEVVDVRRAIG